MAITEGGATLETVVEVMAARLAALEREIAELKAAPAPTAPTAVRGKVEPGSCGAGGMRAYSVDLRRRVLAAVDRGVPRAEVAAAFGVSPATIKRWLARRGRDPDGDLGARRPPGRPPKVRAEELGALRAQLEAHPCATLEEHRATWEAGREARLSIHAVRRAIARLGWTRKEGLWGPPSATSEPGTGGGSG